MIVELFIKSFLIGWIVALPVGPVALLIIHRSVSLGWLRGIISGIGVAFADACFAFFAAAGTIALIQWLENSKDIVKPVGACVLMGVGLYFFFHTPKKQEEAKVLTAKHLHYYIWDMISIFLVTIMNPLTILAYAGLLVEFNILDANPLTPIPYAEIILGISGGSFFWWCVVSRLAQYMKNISTTTEKKIHQVVGIILIIVGITGFASTWIKF